MDRFRALHDETLADDTGDVLAESDHQEWRAAGGAAPQFDQCVGCTIPRFLGGSNLVTSMKITDMEIYWSLTGQIREGLL